MMTPIDRTKYMDKRETDQLRTVTQARAFVDLQHGRRTGVVGWLLVDLALSTGLRVSEMAKLKVGDVDLKRLALHVSRHKSRKQRQESMAIGQDFAAHLEQYLAWKELAGESLSADSALITGKRGPVGVSGLQRIWKSAIAKAGLPQALSIHSARHTLAVRLLSKTHNLRQVQKQLGHASPATTANMYADISFEDMQAGLTGLYDNGNNTGDSPKPRGLRRQR
jgi:site-specific recombinase XerD